MWPDKPVSSSKNNHHPHLKGFWIWTRLELGQNWSYDSNILHSQDKLREQDDETRADTFLQLCWNKTKATGCTAATETSLPTHIWALVRMKRRRKFVSLTLLLLCFYTRSSVTKGAQECSEPTENLHLLMRQKVSGKLKQNTTKV